MFSSQLDAHGTSHLGGAKGVGRVLWPLAFMLGFVSMQHSFEILLYNEVPRNCDFSEGCQCFVKTSFISPLGQSLTQFL